MIESAKHTIRLFYVNRGFNVVSRNEITRFIRGRYSAETTNSALRQMVEGGELRREIEETTGRPRALYYRLELLPVDEDRARRNLVDAFLSPKSGAQQRKKKLAYDMIAEMKATRLSMDEFAAAVRELAAMMKPG